MLTQNHASPATLRCAHLLVEPPYWQGTPASSGDAGTTTIVGRGMLDAIRIHDSQSSEMADIW